MQHITMLNSFLDGVRYLVLVVTILKNLIGGTVLNSFLICHGLEIGISIDDRSISLESFVCHGQRR